MVASQNKKKEPALSTSSIAKSSQKPLLYQDMDALTLKKQSSSVQSSELGPPKDINSNAVKRWWTKTKKFENQGGVSLKIAHWNIMSQNQVSQLQRVQDDEMVRVYNRIRLMDQ